MLKWGMFMTANNYTQLCEHFHKAYTNLKNEHDHPYLFGSFLALLTLKHITAKKPTHIILSDIPETESLINDKSIGQRLNNIFKTLTIQNETFLQGAFDFVDFEAQLGFSDRTKHENYLVALLNTIEELYSLYNDKSDATFNIGSIMGHLMTYGDVFTQTSRQNVKAYDGTIQTPLSVARLMAKLLEPKANENVYDPSCGYGALLRAVASEKHQSLQLFGRDADPIALAITKMMLILSNVENIDLSTQFEPVQENSIASHNRRYDIGVCEPRRKTLEGLSDFENDRSLISSGNYLFAEHILERLSEEGRMAIVMAHGELYQTGLKASEREYLINNNLIDAMISLPPRMYDWTTTPIVVMILKKKKQNDDILLIDATQKEMYETKHYRSVLNDQHLNEIYNLYKRYENYKNIAKVVSNQEVKKNDYYLSFARYFTVDRQPQSNAVSIEKNINNLQTQLSKVRQRIKDTINKLKDL